LRFPTGKARACSLETLSIPSGVLLKIKCVKGNGDNGFIRLTLSFIFIFIRKGVWIIYFELRFPTGKARACSLETLSIPSGVLLKIKCVKGDGDNGVIRLTLSFIFILIRKKIVSNIFWAALSYGKGSSLWSRDSFYSVRSLAQNKSVLKGMETMVLFV
jgi:hypothetical protein